MTKLEWALWAVRETPFYVFRMVPNTKNPIDSCYDATRNEEKIRAWWASSPDANIGYAYFMSGHAIIDIDVKDFLNNGEDTWKGELGQQWPPTTLTYRTISGGYHLIYQDLGTYLPTKSKVWPGIDTRGMGGYGLGLGSIIDSNEYTVFVDAPIQPLPEWVRTGRKSYLDRIGSTGGLPAVGDEWDTPLAINRAKATIARELEEFGTKPIDGYDSDQRSFDLCNRMIDYAIRRSTAIELLRDHWRVFDADWYGEKYDNARQYRENSVGSARPKTYTESLSPEDMEQQRERQAEQRRGKYPFRTPREAAEAPPLTYWDMHKTLPRLEGGCALVAYGPMSSHKTGVVLKYCLDAVEKGARVLYLAPEGAHGINTARLPAACEQRGGLDRLTGLWYTFSTTPGLMMPNEIAELIQACKEEGFKPDIVVIDTLTRAAKGFDISAPATGVGLIDGMEVLAREWDAVVIAVTHPGKDSNKGSIGSSLIESLAYAVWKITYVAGRLVLSVEKMKDGPQDFAIEYDVNETGVPVVTGGKPGEKPSATKRGKKAEAPRWTYYKALVIEQLKQLKPGQMINTTDLVARVVEARGPTESFESFHVRSDNWIAALKREAKDRTGIMGDYVERVGEDAIEPQDGYRWRLPTYH